MKYLFVLNDSAYCSQRTYNALRLAGNLSRSTANEIGVFLIGDGVISALEGLSPAHVHYNTPEMLRQLAARGARIGACKTCLEERGIPMQHLLPCVVRSTLDDLTLWTEEADKVLVF